MSFFDFLKYWLDHHPMMFGAVVIILAFGIGDALSNIFYNEHKAEVDKEHERRFWK